MTTDITIKISKLRLLDGSKPVKAKAEVVLADGAVLIRGFGLGGTVEEPWLSLPSTLAKNGRWYPNVELAPGLKDQILEQFVSAYEAVQAASDEVQ